MGVNVTMPTARIHRRLLRVVWRGRAKPSERMRDTACEIVRLDETQSINTVRIHIARQTDNVVRTAGQWRRDSRNKCHFL
jgi:hypothetical protein